MGTKTAGDVIAPALSILNDVQAERLPPDAYLAHVNAGQVQAVQLRLDLYTLTIQHTLMPGIRQSLPADAIGLVAITGNLDANGNLSSPCSVIDRRALDRQQPDWPQHAASTVVERYMYDKDRPREFDVYPAQPATPGKVELVHGANPPPRWISIQKSRSPTSAFRR